MTRHPPASSRLLAVVMIVVLASTGCGETLFGPVSIVREEGLEGFSASLDSIRVALRIPGLAAAIVQGGEIAWSRGFAQLLAQRILRPLELPHTAPDVNRLADFYASGLDRQAFLANLAMPYELVDGRVVPSGLLRHFSPAAGLVSSVRDMAHILIALDGGQLLGPAAMEEMLSPSIQVNGPDRSYGLGWFVQQYLGVELEWHYGLAIGHSSLIVRAPQQGLAFVIVANTSRLTGAYDIGQWDVMECYPARLFVESFVLGSDPLPLGRGVWNP
jgi:hypothetical protein